MIGADLIQCSLRNRIIAGVELKCEWMPLVVFQLAELDPRARGQVGDRPVLVARLEPEEKTLVHLIRTIPSPADGNFSKTSGSWPGTIRRGSDASVRMRSCAFRLLVTPASPSTVCAIAACFSSFS